MADKFTRCAKVCGLFCVARMWVELGKANGGKRTVVASVKGYKVDTCGVRTRERKTAGESK